jgi:repressor LexA
MAPVIYQRQKQILEFIREHIREHESAPTLREIADAIGVNSLATVHEHLQALEMKKLIKRKTGRTRAIDLPDEPRAHASLAPSVVEQTPVEVPILGFIAAGAPITPFTDPNAKMEIPMTFMTNKQKTYVLQVKGESMIEDHIRDGDYVVVQHADHATDGEIVVALLDNGMATLKRFYKEADRIRLEPSNSTMSPIFAKNVRIQGKVVGLIRKYGKN